MSFTSPWALLLLVPVIAIAVWDALRPWRDGGRGRGAVVAVRVCLISSLVFAASDPRLHHVDRVGYLVVLVDRSASVSDAALEKALQDADGLRRAAGHDRVGLVAFDGSAEVVVYPGATWATAAARRRQPPEVGTDVAAAVRLGLGLIPVEAVGQLVLISDGRSTSGELAQAERRARARGVAVHTLALDPARDDPAVAAVLLDQPAVRPGATLTGRVLLEAGKVAVTGELIVRVGGEVAVRRTLTVNSSTGTQVPIELPIPDASQQGAMAVEATFAPVAGDREVSNNRATAMVLLLPPPQLAIVEGEPGNAEALARALRAEQMVVKVVPPERAQSLDLGTTDLVVLANVPALDNGKPVLPPRFLKQLKHYVNAGGGLIVLGGPQAYDLGGYGNTELADLLPVELDPTIPEIDTAVTLIVILDQSGSMGVPVARGKNKLDLANEGAAASIRLLRPFDQIGVMSVTDKVHWQIPVQPAVDREAMERKVLGIPVSDAGIYIYTSLEAAQRKLARSSTAHKHIILFSDAADSEEQVKNVIFGWGPGPNSYELAARMRRKGTTLSVIGIGTRADQDTQFLRKLAASGGGRFYLTDDARELKGFFVKETERLVESTIIERPFRPVAKRSHPAVGAVDFAAGPKLAGFHDLQARSTAEVVLTGPSDKPIMTVWQYGLGQVIAWSSDAGMRWSEDWLSWPGYSSFWTQAARWALKRQEGAATAMQVTSAGKRAQIKIARRTENGLTLAAGDITAVVVGSDGQEQSVDLRSPQPGLWEGSYPVVPGESYRIIATDGTSERTIEQQFVAQFPQELQHRTADTELLAAVAAHTGGGTDTAAILRADRPRGRSTSVQILWPLLVLLALMLLPVDAYLRRPARVL